MADGEGGGGAGGGEGRGGSSECLPMEYLVEAMLRNSQAVAEALAADRARREAADRAQRESREAARRSVEELQAAVQEKDAEIDRLQEDAADANKKLQADANRKMGWDAACELLLNAAELRDADMDDSRTCAEPPNSKETESCTKLIHDTMDHISRQLRKLEQSCETLSSKKDKKVSALLSENDFLRSKLDIIQQDYAELLKNKKVETAQATKAALKLQKSVDEIKVLAQKKDDEIARLQAEAMEAKKKHGKDISALISEKNSVHDKLSILRQNYAELLKNKKPEAEQATEATLKLQKGVDELKLLVQKKDDEIARLQAEAVEAKKEYDTDLSALLSEKDSVHKQFNIMQQDYTELLKSKKGLTQKKDHEIAILQAEIIVAKKKVQQMQSLVKEKDDEMQRLKGWHVESDQKHYKDISETHKKSMSVDPAVTARDKLKTCNLRKTVEEDYISERKTVEKDGQEKTTQKRRRASSLSNDCEMSRSDADGDKQSERDKDGDKQSTSDEDEHSQSGSDKETKNHKRKSDACNAETANGKSHSESNREEAAEEVDEASGEEARVLCGCFGLAHGGLGLSVAGRHVAVSPVCCGAGLPCVGVKPINLVRRLIDANPRDSRRQSMNRLRASGILLPAAEAHRRRREATAERRARARDGRRASCSVGSTTVGQD